MNDEELQKKIEEILRKHYDVYREMGLFASEWAMLELHVNECIWQLADVSAVAGACITAQIFNINGRLLALISLLRLRKFDEEFIREVNKFAEAIRGAAEKRNRAMHDPIIADIKTETVARLEITAQRQPKFEAVPVTAQQLREDRRELLEFTQRIVEFRKTILETLPTLPQIPKSSFPVNLSVLVPKPNEAS